MFFFFFNFSCFHFVFFSESKDVEVRTGQFLQGVIKSIDKTRKVVNLSSDPDTVSKCVVWFSCAIVFLV